MARGDKMSAILDLRGLDLVTPVDLLKDGRTPSAKNFRLYAQQADDRRVAVSSRKGPAIHTIPLSEAQEASNTASTGASTAKVGLSTGIHLQSFLAATNDRLTRIDIKLSNTESGYGPLLVRVYSDTDGKPGKLISESSILTGDIDETASYGTARFINAPKLVSGDTYWIVSLIQDDGGNTYNLSTTTAGAKAYVTNSSLFSATVTTYAINFIVYSAPDFIDKGSYRFNRDNGQNNTLVAYGTTMYVIDESDGSRIPIATGLSASATNYNFTNGDNKVFWVNSYDVLTAWNGSLESNASNLISNGTFEADSTGWAATGGGTGNAVVRSTSQFHSGVASLSVTATAGANVRSARQTVALSKNHRYKLTYWVRGAAASSNSYAYLVGQNTNAGSTVNLTTSWQEVTYYFTPSAAVTAVDFRGAGTDFFIDDISIIDTGIEYIIDNELPILSDILMHKDRIWGVTATDPNKLVYSENPGNPAFDPTGVTPTLATEQWYYAWLSISFFYVPRPHNGSPVTKIISFQDALQVFTQDKKYVISGYDRGSFFLREATGSKGALSSRGVTSDENSIYFASDDGMYENNGSEDKKLSSLILPLFDGCPRKDLITPVIWKNEVRFYMATDNSAMNNSCVIYNKDIEEWMHDTDTYVNRALYYGDADDDQQLIEFSSHVQATYNAEQDYNSLGAPIDFEYDLKYDSMGTPAQRKRISRYYPLLQGVDTTFPLVIAIDKDFQNSPRLKDVLLITNGARIGNFSMGDGTLLSGDTSFKMHRQTLSGYAYYWQMRLLRKGVNNRVAFIGAQFIYKTKRL